MASPRPRRRRLLLPAAFAAILAIEVTGFAIARSITTTPSTPVVGSATSPITAGGRLEAAVERRPQDPPSRPDAPQGELATAALAHREAASAGTAKPTATAKPSVPRAKPASVKPPSVAPTYRGRNHVWIPSLRISAAIRSFPCSRSRPPDSGVYRWGCAGRNNVYLLGHAWSTFRPLHDAYVRGRLRTGVKVWYADSVSRVHEYRVVWWRVVAPTTAASWAWAPQSRPSMTLQTCVGARSQYRLMVRLLQVR
jgi:sortase (surface protein transpeptidase)